MELYYFPQSYYSQKVYLALLEKGLPFTEHLVFIHLKEQNEDWFLRLNPNGQVPVIKDGNDVINGSEEIVDYIDGKSGSGVRLMPDPSTPCGQRAAALRAWLFAIPVEEITYGVLLNPAVRTRATRFPKMFLRLTSREKYEKSLLASIADFEARIRANPSLEEVFTKKIEVYKWKLATVFDEQNTRKVLQELHSTFDRIEQELCRSRTEAGRDDVWLCGRDFTACDVVMTVLFNRLHLLGLENEYWPASRRPLVAAYHDRLFDRPAVRRFVVDCSMDRTQWLTKQRLVKMYLKKGTKVALAVGALAAVAYGVKVFMTRK